MEEGKLSKFNAGVALTERIDGLQVAMNMSRFNPTGVSPATGTFNYEVMLNAQDGLLAEVWAKLTAKEKQQAERIKNLTHDTLARFPLFKQTREGLLLNNTNYKKFMDLINLYERKNKELLDSHNLNAPNIEDDEGL